MPRGSITAQVDWAAIEAKLPTASTPSGQAERKKLFDLMDTNKNGVLTLTEMQGYLPSVVKNELSAMKKNDQLREAVKCAFNAAKSVDPTPKQKQRKGTLKPDMVGRSELHAALVAFRYYLELYLIFNDIDTGSVEKMLCYKECLKGMELLQAWDIDKADLRYQFKDDWSETLGFEKFADWCIQHRFKKLDLELDENDPNETILEQTKGGIGTVLAAFEKWDEDGSGKIMQDELFRVLKALDPNFTEEQASLLFKSADKNNDNGIDYLEFTKWVMTPL